MLDYNTIFFAECQDGNEFLFTLSILPKLRWFSTANQQVRIFLFCFICAVVFNRDHCGESCAPSRNSSPSQKNGQELLPYIQKSRRGHLPKMGRVLGGIRLSGVLRSENVLLYSSLSASTIFSDGRYKNIQIDQLCDKGMLFCNSPKISFFLITAGP